MLLFRKKKGFSHSLNIKNINALNGKYNIKAIYSGTTKDTSSSNNFSDADLDHYPTLFDELNNGIFVKAIKLDSLKSYTFSLKILNTKRFEIDFFEDDSIIRQNTMRYKLKDDGYIYIKHRNIKIIGIPYLMGGFKNKRSRLTLNKDNNLLFETTEFRSGGVFYLGFLVPVINFGSKMKYEKTYQRIE